MQDLLDRAFLLHLTTAVIEVIARRDEFSNGEAPFVEHELIDALHVLTLRRTEDARVQLNILMAKNVHLQGRSLAYAAVLISRCFALLGKSEEALIFLEAPETAIVFERPIAEATLQWQIANHLRLSRKFNEAMVVLQNALEIVQRSSVPKHASSIRADMASVCLSQGDAARAITLYEQALSDFEYDPDYADTLVRTRGNLASAFQSVERVQEALHEYDELLRLQSVQDDYTIFIAVKLNRAIALKALKRMDESHAAYQDVQTVAINNNDVLIEIRAKIGLSNLALVLNELEEARSLALDANRLARENNISSIIVETHTVIANVDKTEGKVDEAIAQMKMAFLWLESSGDHLNAMKIAADLVSWLTEEERYKDALEIHESSVKIQRKIYEGEIERSVEIASVRTRLANERDAITVRDEERNRVLHSVLPAHIAARLIAGEKQIVDTLPAVTILFADVVGFTKLVSTMEGEELLQFLSKLFAGLDAAATRFGCERIKTIGDSYMAICGASEAVEDHIERVVRMALSVVKGEVSLPIDPSRLRIGINTGSVIAGVMDGQRLSYDVWGDTVNVAARMEEHSRPGEIHCTEIVARRLIANPEFSLKKREPLDIHGKGLMTTYWIKSAF